MAMFKSFLYGGDAPGDDSGDHPVMPLGGVVRNVKSQEFFVVKYARVMNTNYYSY